MGLFDRLFGSQAHQEAWRQLAEELGGEYLPGDVATSEKVRLPTGEWTVTLDLLVLPGYKAQHFYTRLRAPYVRRDDFLFAIHRRWRLFDDRPTISETKPVRTGFDRIDRQYLVLANDEQKIRSLLSNDRIRELIPNWTGFLLRVRLGESEQDVDLPADVAELYFEVPQRITDVDRLKSLVELFKEALETMHEIGSADAADPQVCAL